MRLSTTQTFQPRLRSKSHQAMKSVNKAGVRKGMMTPSLEWLVLISVYTLAAVSHQDNSLGTLIWNSNITLLKDGPLFDGDALAGRPICEDRYFTANPK